MASGEKSITKNYFFNLIKTLNSFLFPIITFSYSSRILGVEGIGKVNFAKSFITYFTIIALLGMNYYGTREAAKLRDDKIALSRFVHEMLMINAVTTIVSYAALFISVLLIPKLRSYEVLLAVNGMAIVLQGLGMEWLYQALEEYQYITIRSVIFQLLALVLMFIFVKDSSDVVPYAVIYVFATFGSYVLNFINARKYVVWRWLGNYKIKKHIKPLFLLFAMSVSIQLYVVLDSTMLGFLQGDAAVGKYTAAVKINKLSNGLITAFGVVLTPRLSYYIGCGQMDKMKELIDKAYNLVFLLSVPASIGLLALSDEILRLFSGKEFLTASVTMKLLVSIVFIIPFNSVTCGQLLVPLGKEKQILLATCAAAITNVVCNAVLIPNFAENGAAIASVLSELGEAIILFLYARHYLDMKKIFRTCYHYWIAAAPILLIAFIIKNIEIYYILRMIIIITCSVMTYFVVLVLFKNCYMMEVFSAIKARYLERNRRKNERY